MASKPKRLLACLVAVALSSALAPCAAFASTVDQAQGQDGAVVEQTGRHEQSWRYDDGRLSLPGDDGIALLSSDLAWSETDEGFLNSVGEVIDGAVRKGIDVSEHQGLVDWEAVKASGIDFAIIRCGYGNDWSAQDDLYWEYNVSECERLGIPYGVYLYSYAENLAMAQSEADHVLRLLEGHTPKYPVYYDLEESSMASADNAGLLADIASLFCGEIEKAGYTPGVYANLNWWNNYLTDDVFDRWDRWVAQYNDSCWYEGDYGLWQATSSGVVDGVSGPVDVNFEMAGFTKDVAEDDWYVESGAYYYVASNGIMTGYEDRRFGPYDPITRGQAVTILWRMAGSPEVDSQDFPDVDYGEYYGDAIEWARSVGVVQGYVGSVGDVLFMPDKQITREELAIVLSNYASVCDGLDASADAFALASKPDASSVSSWAVDAMSWAVGSGVINGVMIDGVAYLKPQDTATRAEMAQMITTYCTEVA